MPSSIDLKSGEPNWTTLENTAVDDAFQLQAILGADATSAAFSGQPLNDPGTNAVVRLFVAPDESAAARQLALWQRAREFNHPNLIRVLGAGSVVKGEYSLIYVAVEPADERLGNALRERPLEIAETRDLLKSLVSALEFLHERGLAHGQVSPDQTFAVGDQIKLSTESIRSFDARGESLLNGALLLAPESEKENLTAAADIWCLGATLVECLTQNGPGPVAIEVPAVSEPLRTIIEQSLNSDAGSRCTLDEIRKHLDGPPTTEKPAAAAPAVRQHPTELPKMPYRNQPSRQGLPIWAYGVGIVVIMAALIWMFREKPQQNKQTAAPVPAAQQKVIPPAPETTTSSHVPSPAPPVKRTPSGAPSQGGNKMAGHGRSIWRVVVYTYTKRESAESKAAAINRTHPQLHAEALSPDGKSGGPYLVVIGDSMTRDEARRFRQIATNSGMPRDSYILNFSQ